MVLPRRAIVELVVLGSVAGLIAFGLAYATGIYGARPRSQETIDPTKLEAGGSTFSLHEGASELTVKSADGKLSRDVQLSIVVDGAARPVSISREQMRATSAAGFTASFPLAIGADTVEGALDVQVDPPNDALHVELRARGNVVEGHTLSLRMDLSANGQIVFASGTGEIADGATVTGAAAVVDADPHPLGIVSSRGELSISAVVDDANAPLDTLRLSATSPPRSFPSDEEIATDLRIAVGASSTAIWRSLYALAGIPTLKVKGSVTGTSDRAHIFGRDSDGEPQVRATASPGNSFDLDVPANVVEWYASIDAARASALASFIPGSKKDLVLDVSPGGELHVTISDYDTHKPIVARLLVRGVDGSVDPSFGADYRASGAGPIIDSQSGEVRTPLPSGRYRVAVTKGIEWSIDAKEIEIAAGRTVDVELSPRHVVPTPGMVACDLHVHSRPSFDSPVTVEDRVLSLASAGIEFAVPTEHNVVGDYTLAIATLGLQREFLSVNGVEVTTYGHGFGHFGVFPYPLTQKVPPYHNSSPALVFDKAREGDFKHERVLVVHHPRLPKGIGYFNIVGFSSKGAKPSIHGRMDFDALEVFNGYDDETIPRVEEVLRDYYALMNAGYHQGVTGSSDSHRIQFHWAGYPRTMVLLPGAPDRGIEGVDTAAIVAAIKHGHTEATNGPIIEFELAGGHPGDERSTQDDPLHGHVRVRAAPWIDVTRVDIVVGGHVMQTFDVPPRPTEIGPIDGTADEIAQKSIRFDEDVTVSIGGDNGWVQVVVRGDRRMDDVLPFMPVQPFAFTTPVWIVRHYAAPPSTNPQSSSGSKSALPPP
jgi:hypothetical protein